MGRKPGGRQEKVGEGGREKVEARRAVRKKRERQQRGEREEE